CPPYASLRPGPRNSSSPRLLGLPRRHQAGEVGRLCLVVDGIVRDRDPGLRALGPDVSHWPEPRGVVERAGLDDRGPRIALRIVEQPDTAVAAEQAVDDAAALELPAPDRGRAVDDGESIACNRERERKRAARLALAFRAVADIHGERRRRDLVAHASTLASTGQ